MINMYACMKGLSYCDQSLPLETYLTSKNLCEEFQASENLENLQDKNQKDESDYDKARKSSYTDHLNINPTVRIKPALWDPTVKV